MRVGRVEYAPDYRSRRVRGLRSQDVECCQWCGRGVEVETLRKVEVSGKKFKVCAKCPPPDNANAMRT